ncbi:MAG: hypothetical protein M1823_004778 [Watsoniomyces obsoletus]|nr:MAG: hypothetical protein M1823_004778 [Watsoniomyces obsoletus]
MTRRYWGSFPLLWLAVLLLGFVSIAQTDTGASHVPHDETQTPQEDEYAVGQVRSARQYVLSGDEHSSKAANSIAIAREILHNIKEKTHHAARSNRPSGILSTTTSFAKQAFVFLFMKTPVRSDQTQPPKLSKPLSKAITLLYSAAEDHHPDAIYLLAEINFYGTYGHPRNFTAAYEWYHNIASLNGNASAQHMLGFMYATGLGGVVPVDTARSLLYYTFSAAQGYAPSEMAVAYRHHSGIGTMRNCDEAVRNYKKVAQKAIAYWRSGPPGGRSLLRPGYRLADDEGGAYGEGASAISSGVYASTGTSLNTPAALDDVLEYWDLMSRKGELRSTFSLARLYYEGSRLLPRDLRKAKVYFMMVAKRYWPRDGRSANTNMPGLEKLAAKAAGFLGRMALRGEAMEPSHERALMWFRRGVENGDAICQNGMGMMYLNGWGVPKDAGKAAEYFKAAAEQDFGAARVNLGTMYLDEGNIAVATHYYELAARHGHIEAFYYLAEMADQGLGQEQSCLAATLRYKIVGERAEEIHSPLGLASQAYDDGDIEMAWVLYMMAAEQGYEVGQANVAYLLDEEKSWLPLPRLLRPRRRRPSLLRNPYLALMHWTRSARQSNVDSMVKMGDYYLKGVGTEADDKKASSCYQAAADHQQSAQALWNMGWMHENGVGVEQDFHLAKRNYDLALETSPEAYLPVLLALLKLRLRSFWNTMTHGHIKSIQSEPEEKREWSFWEWINHFMKDDQPYDDFEGEEDHDDLGDPVSETHPHHETNGGGGGYGGDFIDDGTLESLIIVGLAGCLVILVYFHQQRQLNRARQLREERNNNDRVEQQQQQQQQPDRGLFPQPGDPDFAQWVAGGVAH